MEGTMTVNDIFDEEVTKITASMLPPHFSGDVRTTRAVQERVAKIIDALGEESATSQGLNKVITSAEKLNNNPAHIIYLLKDVRGDEGRGEIIGMLKVGRKHLFLFDTKERVHEVEPLCVLDFYVLHDRQRCGFGRMLYDFMLHDLEILAAEMAIDGPSVKMEKFLARNFAIEKLLRQNNNFAVAPTFFDRTDAEISAAGRATTVVSAAVGRFAAAKPTSAIANVIHGSTHEDASRRSAAPDDAAGPAPRAVPAPEQAVEAPVHYLDPWDDCSDPSEPEYDDNAYEDDFDMPAAERRDEMRARGVFRGYSPAAPERPEALAVQRATGAAADVPAAGMPSGAQSGASTPHGRRDSQLTERGYFDVKNYHNKLW